MIVDLAGIGIADLVFGHPESHVDIQLASLLRQLLPGQAIALESAVEMLAIYIRGPVPIAGMGDHQPLISDKCIAGF